jgi:hypothetical protein
MSFEQLDGEMWLAERLGELGVRVFDGLTDRAQRIERFRAAIETVGSHVIAGRRRDGKPETYAQVFERLYAEPLAPVPTPPGPRKADHAAGKQPDSPG